MDLKERRENLEVEKEPKEQKVRLGGEVINVVIKEELRKWGGFGKSRKKLEANLEAAQTEVDEAEENVRAFGSWLQPGTGAVDERGRETTPSEKQQANMIEQQQKAAEKLNDANAAFAAAEMALKK